MDINMSTLSPGTNTITANGVSTFTVPAASTYYYSIDMYGGGGAGGNALQLTGSTPADDYLKKSGGGGAAGAHFTTSAIVPIANTGATPLTVNVNFVVGAKGISSALEGNQGTDGLSSSVTLTPLGGTPVIYTALGGNTGKGAYTGGYTAASLGGTGSGDAGGAGGIDTLAAPGGTTASAVSGTGFIGTNATGFGGGGGGGVGGGQGGDETLPTGPFDGSDGTTPGAGGGGGAYGTTFGVGGNGADGLITFTLVDNLPNVPSIQSTTSTFPNTLDVVFDSNLLNTAGAPPTSYTVTLTGGGVTYTQTVPLSAGIPIPLTVNSQFTVTFASLTAGVLYDVVVTAVSSAGNTSTIPTSAVGFDAGVPLGTITPTIINGVIEGTTSLTVFFNPVPTLQYSVNLYLPGTFGILAPIVSTPITTPTTGTIIVTPLNPSTGYEVELLTYANNYDPLTNLPAPGSNVASGNYTTLDAEEAATMTAAAGNASITVTFNQSVSQPVGDYTINVYDTLVNNYFSNPPVYTELVQYDPAVSTYTTTLNPATPFVNGVEYMIIVTNGSGLNLGATPPEFVTPNGAPIIPASGITFGVPTPSVSGELELSFLASTTPYTLLTDYTVVLTNTTTGIVVPITISPIAVTSASSYGPYLFTGLTVGDQYSVSVTPNGSFTSATSPSVATASPVGVLPAIGVVTALSVVNPLPAINPYEISVTFPPLPSNASFSNYSITVTDVTPIIPQPNPPNPPYPTTPPFTVTIPSTTPTFPILIDNATLIPGNLYTVTVTPINITIPGITATSTTSSSFTFYGPIAPPTIPAPNFNNGSSQVQINIGRSTDQYAFLSANMGVLSYNVSIANQLTPSVPVTTFTLTPSGPDTTSVFTQINPGILTNGNVYIITATTNIPANTPSLLNPNPFTGPSASVTNTFYLNLVTTTTTGNTATVTFPLGNTIFPATIPFPTINASGYTIKLYEVGNPTPVETNTVPPTLNGSSYSYPFTGLVFGTQYYATVETSPITQTIQSASFSLAGLAPPVVTATAIDGTATVTYTDPNGPGVDYALSINTPSGSTSNITVSQPQNNTFTVFGLEPSTLYTFTVTASLPGATPPLAPVPSLPFPLTTTDFITYIDIQGEAICYVKGTYISTARGWIPIEKLTINDSLKTYDLIKTTTQTNIHGLKIENKTRVKNPNTKSMFAPVKFVGTFAVNKMNEKTAPIRIKAGAFAPNKPERDLLVSPNHGIFMGEKLIYAKLLVNGTTIYQDMNFDSVEYYHVLCDNHYIINSNGILSESLGSEELKFFLSLDAYSKKIPAPIQNELDLLVF